MKKLRDYLDLAAVLGSLVTLAAAAHHHQAFPQPVLAIYLTGITVATAFTLLAGIKLTASGMGPSHDRHALACQGNRMALWSTISHASCMALAWTIILAF